MVDMADVAGMKDVPTRAPHRHRGLAFVAAVVAAAVTTCPAPAEETAPSPAERMAALGLVRHRGAWRTPQEVELIERDEAATLAGKQWVGKLRKLRGRLDQPAADRAAEEIREISDPLAVAALAGALATEPVFQVRRWYLESLGRIRTPDAVQVLVAVARDHADPETRIAAVERLVAIGPHQAVPPLVAALASADNAQVNRAAEALGRLGVQGAIGPLIDSLETRHVAVTGSGPPEGSTSATFTPQGGGLSMGNGQKRAVVAVRNPRVLEALVSLTGQNFEWNAAAWRAWLINERALPRDFDPRRS